MDRPDQTSDATIAARSPPTSTPPADNPSAQGSDMQKPVIQDRNDVKTNAVNEISEKLPLREDQVQNAVKFLSHPRVRGSPVVHRRSFLENKGLTKEEIDEAFRRVPDSPPSATNGEGQATNPDISTAMRKTSPSTLESQERAQAPLPTAAPGSTISTAPTQQLSRFHWFHGLAAAGVLAASGVGTVVLLKSVAIPRLKAWVKKVVTEESESEKDRVSTKLAEEAAEAAKAAASAAAVVSEASQELLSTKNEERKYFEAFMGALDVQVKEMKSMGDAIRRMESRRADRFSDDKLMQENILHTRNGTTNNNWRTSQHVKVNGAPNTNFGEERPSSPPALTNNLAEPNRHSYSTRWESAPSQQRPIYSVQPQSSEEEFASKIVDGINGDPPEMTRNGNDTSEPWWLKKNVRITELEPEEEQKQLPHGSFEANERPKQRGWVPPQPPSVVMPEAAVAIRRPKPPVQKQLSGDERSVASSDDGKGGEIRDLDPAADAVDSDGLRAGTSEGEVKAESAVAAEFS